MDEILKLLFPNAAATFTMIFSRSDMQYILSLAEKGRAELALGILLGEMKKKV